MLPTDRRTLLKIASGAGLMVGAAPLLGQSRTAMLPPISDWLTIKPDAKGIVRFAVDVAVIGNSDTIDP